MKWNDVVKVVILTVCLCVLVVLLTKVSPVNVSHIPGDSPEPLVDTVYVVVSSEEYFNELIDSLSNADMVGTRHTDICETASSVLVMDSIVDTTRYHYFYRIEEDKR